MTDLPKVVPVVIYRLMPNQEGMASVVSKLEELLIKRDIPASFALARAELSDTASLDAGDPAFISLVLCAAQLNDLGLFTMGWLETLTAKLPPKVPEMRFIDFFRTELIEAYQAFATEQTSTAIVILGRILICGEHLGAPLLFVAHFWKGRAHRQLGEYADAQKHISAAQTLAVEVSAPRLVAVTKVHESWLVFQAGERRRAFELLDEAETELRPVQHALSLGNIESARGRFVRRSGDYAAALKHFENAVALYEADFPNHPNLGRALANAAYVKRLMALDLKSSGTRNTAPSPTNAQYLELTGQALDLLRRAGDLYARSHHPRGLGTTLVNAGHLHLESGDIEQASAEAEQAFRFAEQRSDQILLARTRNLQSRIERALSEEQMIDSPDPAVHVRKAIQYADEAITFALHTQNKRLLAETYITRGAVAMDESVEAAKDYLSRASALLDSSDRDHLVKELVELKLLIMRTSKIDETLRRWSNGQIAEKSFTQIQEEFAELVIPKVWINLGRNVAEVSRQLSISPKKVRRILRTAGHKE